MFYKKRIKYAAKFGKLEHKAGRIIVIPILLNILYCYTKKCYVGFTIALVTFMLWATYLIAHTIEKKLYPNRFRF